MYEVELVVLRSFCAASVYVEGFEPTDNKDIRSLRRQSQIKHSPLYIQTMGDAPPISITRIIHEGEEGEPPSRDYDFSRKSI